MVSECQLWVISERDGGASGMKLGTGHLSCRCQLPTSAYQPKAAIRSALLERPLITHGGRLRSQPLRVAAGRLLRIISTLAWRPA
jgi:hypothetical protein